MRSFITALLTGLMVLPGEGASAAPTASAAPELNEVVTHRRSANLPWSIQSAQALVDLLETSALDGLSPETYGVKELRHLLSIAETQPERNRRQALDEPFSRALVRFAADVARPRDAGVLYVDSAARPRLVNSALLLRRAAQAPSLHAFVAQMQWMNPVYVELRQELIAGGGDAKRKRLLRLNMERARSLPRGPGRYILVNVPSAKLEVREGNRILESMRVVVGKKEMQTPIMAGMMRYAILNPFWHVPPDLTRERIAPRVLKEGRAYLDSKGYEVLSEFSRNPRVLDPMSLNWKAVAAGHAEAFVRQRPGVQNGMGEIKFMFPNEMGIYLHDTPGKTLFERDDRLASAGCVRLEDAGGLARLLLGDAVVRAPSTPEHVIPLSKPVPVYLAYLTAFPERGRIIERPDVYGKDRELAHAALQRRARTFSVSLEGSLR